MTDYPKFDHPNMHNFRCRVCNTSADQPIYLIPVPGSEVDGISRAEQIHTECFELFLKMFAIEKEVGL